uniref:transcription initiation factor TFIID subunit 5-like n=1 Tax=Erigeron canadensis TaxID=72917 RepID=UPI001CB8FB5D|nr:transcription initiation factor TFIID subunit 5-like [Erigeron canadensis]
MTVVRDSVWVHEQYSLKKRNLIGGSKHIPVRRRAGDILYYKVEVNRNSTHEGPVLDVSYNSTRRLLASSSTDCVVRVWNLPTARRIRDYKNHTSQVNAVEWNPINHDFFLSGSNKEVILDDSRDYEPPKRWATKSEVKTVAWNHSNQYQFMINCADGTALVQDIRNGPHLAVGDGDISAVSYHPTKNVYAMGSRTGMVKVWEANSSKELQQVNHMFRRSGRNKKARENICISCLSFSPDGENLAYGTTNGTFGLIKVQS